MVYQAVFLQDLLITAKNSFLAKCVTIDLLNILLVYPYKKVVPKLYHSLKLRGKYSVTITKMFKSNTQVSVMKSIGPISRKIKKINIFSILFIFLKRINLLFTTYCVQQLDR